MNHLTTAVVVLKTLTLVLGGTITYLAFKAFRRTGSAALRSLTLGFGLVTLGALLAGFVDQLAGFRTDAALVVESALTVAGFAVIVYSLYVDR
ncbi:MAG: hypothetical protein ABEJ92_02545 [Halobacteriales archaeon]